MTKRIRADFANIQVLSPFPGTELYQLAVQNGWLLDGLDFDGLRSDTFVMNATALDHRRTVRECSKKCTDLFISGRATS